MDPSYVKLEKEKKLVLKGYLDYQYDILTQTRRGQVTVIFGIFNLGFVYLSLMLIPCCVSVRTMTDSVSVAPVRYPVVQISFKLHILNER